MRTPLVVVWITLSGCVGSTAVAIGPGQRPRPSDCPIEIAEQAPEELTEKYRRVGSVCVTNASKFGPPENVTDAIKHPSAERDELFGQACALSGEVVAASGICSIGKASAVEFAVLRARSTAR